MMEYVYILFGWALAFLIFGNAFAAHYSWRKSYEIEAVWRMLNAIFWAVVYYSYYAWQ